MIGLLTIGAIALLALRKKRGVQNVAGIGAPYKRRIYQELAAITPGADFNLPYEDQNDNIKRIVQENCNRLNSKYPNRIPITVERYFKQLRRAYNAISGIGETNLPYRESVVRNYRGDVILIHRDYGTQDEQLQDAIFYIEENYTSSDFEIGYWNTLLAIATGQKFVWSSDGVHRGLESLVFGKSAPGERKLRISYLASPNKGGVYIERFVESITGDNWKATDDMELLDGALDAIRTVESVKQAKQIILDTYYKDHILEDNNPDLPF